MNAYEQPTQPANLQSTSITVDQNGTYRWVYEFNLFTNPTILLTVLKILVGIAAVGVAIMMVAMIPDLMRGYTNAGDVLESLRSGGFFILFFFVLTCIGYAVYAAMQGGKYCVVFTMDEHGIQHKQLPKQFKKAQVMGALNVVAGLATGNPTQMGIGAITSTRNAISSDFAAVRSILGYRRRGVIKVNEPLAKNQVYAEAQDYDFVFNYIAEHCPNAVVK